MGFKCKHCGWKPEYSSYYPTREDMKECRDHLKICEKENEK